MAQGITRISILIALTLMHIAYAPQAFAQAAAPVAPAPAADPGAIGGIVLNQTVTVGGQEFYRHFVSQWRDKPLTEQYAISIHERPSARFGSQIWVEYAQRRMFQSALPVRRAAIGPLSERAVEVAYQSIVDTDMQRLLFKDVDLGRDEI